MVEERVVSGTYNPRTPDEVPSSSELEYVPSTPGLIPDCRTKGEGHTLEASKSGPGKEQAQPGLTTDPAGSEPSEEDASPEGMTPEQEASQETQKRVEELLGAYQETLDTVEDLPAVVWVPWDRK